MLDGGDGGDGGDVDLKEQRPARHTVPTWNADCLKLKCVELLGTGRGMRRKRMALRPGSEAFEQMYVGGFLDPIN